MRQAAQRMFFQAATRIAARPLEDGSGDLREALTSLKTLFDLYREPLESDAAPLPPAKGHSVYELALDILNFELALFLAKWHPRLRTFEEAHPGGDESTWPQNAAFREELRELQRNLRAAPSRGRSRPGRAAARTPHRSSGSARGPSPSGGFA